MRQVHFPVLIILAVFFIAGCASPRPEQSMALPAAVSHAAPSTISKDMVEQPPAGRNNSGRAAFTGKKVTATGVARVYASNFARARQNAIQNAIHSALDQGLMSMDASSVVKNDDLMEKIYTHTRGVITDYRIIDEKKEANGLYRVRLVAYVDTGKLRGRLEELGLIKAMMDYPRIMIVPLKNNRDACLINGVSNRMIAYFSKTGFYVLDADHASVAGSGLPSWSAEITIRFSVNPEPGYSDGILEYRPVTIRAKAIVSSTGQILSADEKREVGVGNSRQSALSDGCEKAAVQTGASLRGTILKWWADYTANGAPYVVELRYPAGEDRILQAFQNGINSVPGVVSVSERDTKNGVSRMQVKFRGQSTDLKYGIINALAGAPGFEKLRTIFSRGRYLKMSIR